ncbi:IclR family transcriptional regulator [Aquincola tertiaricarbonis]|uniref:IclR family transcriptional regulator n=1 Tax=Aquincola tertiaricarbonis TaxID=391953 RepID=UPI000614E480|nr:IclR family transcriptional regulator [Aquincola tertiaricarbonis]
MSRRRITPEDTPAEEDRRYVTALARGLEVLRCFRPQDRWLSHQEIARRTGLPQATVSRLTFTLTHLGYLRHQADAGQYALAGGVLALGFSMLSNFDIARIARPVMQAIADRVEAAVSMGLRHELQMVYVAHCRGAGRLTLGLDVGARLPLPDTAMGRALLCALPATERDAVCALLQQADAGQWPRQRVAIDTALAQHARWGYVLSEQDWQREISAVGVPVQVGDGRPPLALTIGGPSSYLTHEVLMRMGPMLVEAAAQISMQIHAGGA